MTQRSVQTIDEIRGVISLKSVSNPDVIERTNYILTVDGAKKMID